MNQAKINAIIRQIFGILGSLVVFVPSLSGVAELLPATETLLNEIVGIAIAVWSLIGQYRTVLDAKNVPEQTQILNTSQPSWSRGFIMYLQAA